MGYINRVTKGGHLRQFGGPFHPGYRILAIRQWGHMMVEQTGGSPQAVRRAISPRLSGTERSTSSWGVLDIALTLTDRSILSIPMVHGSIAQCRIAFQSTEKGKEVRDEGEKLDLANILRGIFQCFLVAYVFFSLFPTQYVSKHFVL